MLNPENKKWPIEEIKTVRQRGKISHHKKSRGAAPTEKKEYKETILLFIKILITVFLCEAAIMTLLHLLSLKGKWNVVIDPILLTVLSTPLLYWLLFRPIYSALEQRNHALELLQLSEQRYRSFVQNFQGIVYQGSLDFIPVFFKGKVEEITGYSEEEFLQGRPQWDQIIHQNDIHAISETAEKIQTIAGYTTEREYRIKRKDKQIRWVYELIQNICDNSGKPDLVQGAIYDITERKHMEEDLKKQSEHLEEMVKTRTAELTETNKQLLEEIKGRKLLEKELLNIIEQERQRMGQELHDSIGQQLTGIEFMMESLREKLTNKSLAEESSYAEKINACVSQTTGKVRNLAKGLHPIDLGRNGLVSALEELAANTEQLFSISCTLNYEKVIMVNDVSVAINLYRITQEAITNAIKHGKAKNIKIKLTPKNNCVTLLVENDGADFPAEQTYDKGMGLQIMRYRAEMIDGSLDIGKGIHGGTIVTCVFPKKGHL